MQYKKAAFNSMVYRMVNIPLTTENYEKERKYIHEAAMVDKLIYRFNLKKMVK